MPHSLHPHLHPSFVWLLSSRQCENTQETFTTMGLFTHLLLIRDLSVHRAGGRALRVGGWRREPVFFRPHKNKHFHKSGS